MNRSIRRTPLALVAALALVSTSCAQLLELPELKPRDLKRIKLAESSKIYDGDGRLITSLHGPEDRTIVPLKKIGENVRRAVIAIEDERFYEHDGIDVRAVARALISNITSGDVREGGSTITQQYVKNTLISPGKIAERSLERKIEEAALARQLEKQLTKDEILERYLNTVYFGQGAYGVQAASKLFFNKPSRKLSLHQSALLAGVIRAPEDYDPFDRTNRSKARRNLVIDQMLRLGYIDEEQAERAKSKKLGIERGPNVNRYAAPYFLDYVHRLVKYDDRFKAIGRNPDEREQQLFQGGLRIYTTVDLEMQAAAERAVEGALPYDSDPHASLVALDPHSGHVKAMVGGRDWFAKKKQDPYAKLNLAIQGEPGLACFRGRSGTCTRPFEPGPAPGTGRQAGSAFKTFALAEAIRQGIPLSKIYAAPNCINLVVPETGEPWPPCNYEGSSFGSLSLLDATIRSVNTVYAQLILEVGSQEVVDLAHDMGIRSPLLAVPSAVLGSNEVNPLGMASGYGTLAANGDYHPPVAITRIVKGGKVLYEDDSVSEPVLDPAVAYLTTSALEQVITRGTAARYGNIGRPAAGKTGTAQEYRDAWFVGYTPDLVAAVWVGYPGGQIEMKTSCVGSIQPCRVTRTTGGSGVTGGSFPTMIWQAFMLGALDGVPARPFSGSDVELVRVTLDTRGEACLATTSTPEHFREDATFPKGTEPTEPCEGPEGTVEVPNVVGFAEADANQILTDTGFVVARVEEPTNAHPPGRVIAQSPIGGALAGEGAVIRLTISVPGGGGDRATVPNVIGLTDTNARERLEAASYRVMMIYEAEPGRGRARNRRGLVWAQDPDGGRTAKRNSRVTVWVNPR